jgi:hypothetical protein
MGSCCSNEKGKDINTQVRCVDDYNSQRNAMSVGSYNDLADAFKADQEWQIWYPAMFLGLFIFTLVLLLVEGDEVLEVGICVIICYLVMVYDGMNSDVSHYIASYGRKQGMKEEVIAEMDEHMEEMKRTIVNVNLLMQAGLYITTYEPKKHGITGRPVAHTTRANHTFVPIEQKLLVRILFTVVLPLYLFLFYPYYPCIAACLHSLTPL